MKLTKEMLKHIFEQLIFFKNYSMNHILNLQSHIEALEQELAVKPRFVALIKELECPTRPRGTIEPKGFIFEVTERGKEQWDIVSGKYKGERIHKSHVTEIDINQAFTGLTQENLMRLEEVKGLQRQVESLVAEAKLRNRKYDDAQLEIQKMYNKHRESCEYQQKFKVAYEAEKESRMLLEATLERALLDHQPIALTKKQAIALDHLRNELKNYDIITSLATCSWSNGRSLHFNELFDMDRNVLVTALVNGYTVEPEPENVTDAVNRIVSEWHLALGTGSDSMDVSVLSVRLADYAEEIKQ